jgi:hypothetical protein
MAIVSAICTSYKKELMEGVHTSSDEYKIALYTSAADLSAATSAYTTVEEVSGVGYVAGGQTLTNVAISLDGTVSIFDADNPTWVNATLTARGALLYNASKSNKAVAVLDFGADYSATNGSFVVVLPSPTATEGLIRLA